MSTMPTDSSGPLDPSNPKSPFNLSKPVGLIGRGRSARHLAHYLSLKKIPFIQIHRETHRASERSLDLSRLKGCPVVILAVSDAALEELAATLRNRPDFSQTKLCHLSGALHSDHVFALHPLISFGPELFDEKFYERMAFVGDERTPPLSELIPGLKNPFFRVPQKKHALYHALCVLGANLSTLLWLKFFEGLSTLFKIPAQHSEILFESVSKNIAAALHSGNARAALTGPWIRNDQKVVELNEEALRDDPFLDVYRSGLKAYRIQNQREGLKQ